MPLRPNKTALQAGYIESDEEDDYRHNHDEDNDGNRDDTHEFSHADLDRERERQQWEDDALDEIEFEKRKLEKIAFIEQLKEETRRGREKHQFLKNKRQQAMEKRKEMLKAKGQARRDGSVLQLLNA